MSITTSTGAPLVAERRRLEWRAGTRIAARGHFEVEVVVHISPRSNWRVVIDETGEVIGFVTPRHNHYNPVIGYFAVMPGHHGQGYITDILNEGVTVLAATGVDRFRAATDMTNTPMANRLLG